ncbi:MAG: hypothetical protein IKE12_05040 [Erysipelotrichaceae bacterium]|nr:hypothetical protein [Erysipelotrichaceae bacterium]MBR2792011.1 hypothetical protein [Erysipelotrichaceae bacterium]
MISELYCDLYRSKESLILGICLKEDNRLCGLAEYLYTQTDIEIITASTMVENLASERVLEKNDFLATAKAVPEDWGYPEPTIADKWFR